MVFSSIVRLYYLPESVLKICVLLLLIPFFILKKKLSLAFLGHFLQGILQQQKAFWFGTKFTHPINL